MIGIIGGSGLYAIDDLEQKRVVALDSVYGKPSSSAIVGNIEGKEFAFLPRHGLNHELSPSEINFRANIEGLKRIGVNKIISISAVGSLKKEHHPSKFVLVDQYIDRTYRRKSSFFENGVVAHIPFGDPVCQSLSSSLVSILKKNEVDHSDSGTYVCIEGPQFSTRAESELYRSWGCDVIGMTNMPEAKLAREAGICYSSLAMVTDYDCWHPDHDEVTIEAIQRVMSNNINNAHMLIKSLPSAIEDHEGVCSRCSTNISSMIMTNGSEENIDFLRLIEELNKNNES